MFWTRSDDAWMPQGFRNSRLAPALRDVRRFHLSIVLHSLRFLPKEARALTWMQCWKKFSITWHETQFWHSRQVNLCLLNFISFLHRTSRLPPIGYGLKILPSRFFWQPEKTPSESLQTRKFTMQIFACFQLQDRFLPPLKSLNPKRTIRSKTTLYDNSKSQTCSQLMKGAFLRRIWIQRLTQFWWLFWRGFKSGIGSVFPIWPRFFPGNPFSFAQNIFILTSQLSFFMRSIKCLNWCEAGPYTDASAISNIVLCGSGYSRSSNSLLILPDFQVFIRAKKKWTSQRRRRDSFVTFCTPGAAINSDLV